MSLRFHLLHQDPSALPKDFWNSPSCEVLLPLNWAQEKPREVEELKRLTVLPSHVWVSSSGTLAGPGVSKWVALSKTALLASAQAVNQHLEVRPSEVWGLALPLAHVGGLGIMARAHILGQQVMSASPNKWHAPNVASMHVHLLSLVPTQLYDLVAQKLRAPSTLRAVIIGGDRLDPELNAKAQALGWPIRTSYGLTEMGSQVATALSSDRPELMLLPHVKARLDAEERLLLSSPALFTGHALVKPSGIEYVLRSTDEWASDDRAQLAGRQLTLLGRLDSIVKVKGEKVDLSQLETQLCRRLGVTLIVMPLSDEREGTTLVIVAESQVDLTILNQELLPHQRIRRAFIHPGFPRTALGKIKRSEVRTWLTEQT